MNPAPAPTVTVIIATYNKEQTLPHAITSVLWQTFRDFECLVIGDACTDRSEALVTAIDDPRLFWINLPENSGYQSAPNNEGLRRAKGKYIAYLNDDDVWLPTHLQMLIESLERNAADFAYSIIERFDTDYVAHPDIPAFPDAERPPEASATVHRQKVVDQIGLWKLPAETRMNPRVEWFRTAQLQGCKFVLVPLLTVLKFGAAKGEYGRAGLQESYIKLIGEDPQFAEKELGKMLVEATHQLNGPVSFQQLRHQLLQTLRRMLVKRNVDPGHLTFWLKPGQRIKEWRKFQGLDVD